MRQSFGTAGPGIVVSPGSTITGASTIHLGENVHIGEGAFIRGEGGLTIGDNTHVSRNMVLYTVNHDWNGQSLPYDSNQVARPVTIGRNVWIGMNVCVAPGATIGDGAIIGMGTVVSGDVPPMAIVASQPWRQVGERDKAHYAGLEKSGRYGASGGHLYKGS